MRRAPQRPGKLASAPEMGSAMYSPLSSATGDSGRSHGRTNDDPANNAASAFEEQQKQLLNHPHNEAHPFPVGANQSALLKSAAEDWTKKLLESSSLPLRTDPELIAAADGGPAFGNDKGSKFIVHDPAQGHSWPGLAHELGHADIDDTLLGQIGHSRAADWALKATPFVGLAQGFAGVRWPTTLATAGLLAAPRIGAELGADYQGYQRLKRLGADDATLREYLSSIALPQASYAAMPLLATGANRAANFAMKAAKHKLARRMKFQGLDISIETDVGDKREWYDPHEDKHGVTVMKYPYGYIRKTLGTDGDHVDVYVGPDEGASYVYVINQMKAPEFKEFDEQKCMLGFPNAAAAKSAYLKQYNNPRFFGSMKKMSLEDFRAKVLDKKNHGEKVAAKAVYYHGSPHKLTTLRGGSWVTPHKEDAAVFGAPWGSKDLHHKGGDDGRPPQQLDFKKEPPKDHPVYVYEVSGNVKPALTNTGREYDWNRQLTAETPVKLVEVIPSWHDRFIRKEAAHADDRFAERSTLGKPHLKTLRDVLHAAGPHKLPEKFTVPLVDGSKAVVMRTPGSTPKLTLKTVLSARMKSKDPVITVDTLHSAKHAALSDSQIMDLAGFKQTSDANVSESQVARGTRVEKEHTDRAGIARQIAVDHLNERPDYYKLLERHVENAPPGAGNKLASLRDYLAKRASDFSAFSPTNTATRGPGPTHNQVPGDFLGLPMSQPGGYRKIVGGHPEVPDEGIARTFRFHDEPTDTYTMDGNTAAQPSGPAV